MVYKFFAKKSGENGVDTSRANKSATEPNHQLANELHKQIIRKFKRRKVYSSFRDNIWGVDLADMQSLGKCNKVIKHLLRAIDLFSKYEWTVLLKDKIGISIVNAFQKVISKESKPNKIWVDQGGKFYNNLFKRFPKINSIEMYSTQNEGKSVIAERFIKTLKKKLKISQLFQNMFISMCYTILLINTITQFIDLLK